MFKMFNWANAAIKKYTWQDMALVKLGVMGFTLLLAKLWAPILSLEWYWYAAIFLAASMIPAYKLFKG